MSDNNCLIDFEPFPKVPDPYYDPDFARDYGSLCEYSRTQFHDFSEDYDAARKLRISKIALAMRQRLLTDDEEVEAIKLGAELTDFDKAELSDVWFQQRRLQMLAKGINIQ